MGDRITEIAAIRMRNGTVEKSFQSLVNPLRAIPDEITDMTGINRGMVADAPEFYEIADEFLRFIEGSALVFHNAPFDLSFLVPTLRLIRHDISYTVIDTLVIARKCFDFPSNTLGNIAGYLDIPLENAHRAMDDVIATSKVFSYFLTRLERDMNVLTLQDLVRLQGPSVVFPDFNCGEIPHSIDEALKTGGILKIKYVTKNGGESVREIEPREIVTRDNYTYLVAFCYFADSIRVFRMDRIASSIPL